METDSSSLITEISERIKARSSPLPDLQCKPVAEAASLGLELHNKYRFDHGVPLLKLDSNLSQQAEAIGHSIANGKSPTECDIAGIGRNIYKIQSSRPGQLHTPTDTVREAVTMWYGYSKDYNWRRPMSSPLMTKLFSQMVWKSSQKLGLGVVSRGGGKLIVVVTLYSPGGNVGPDQNFIENVPKLESSSGGSGFKFIE